MCLSTFEESIKLKYIFSPLAGNKTIIAAMAHSPFNAGGQGRRREDKSGIDVAGGRQALHISYSYSEREIITSNFVVIAFLDNCFNL